MSETSGSGTRTNEATGLREYLESVGRRVRELPPAWVRCELLKAEPSRKYVRMELVDHDAGNGQIAKVQGGCWPNDYERILAAFAAAGLVLEAGSKVLVQIKARLDPIYGFRVEVLDVDPSFTLGDLHTRTEAIRRKLKQEGVWNGNRSLPKPKDFVRLAVISPAGAAGLGDFRSTADVLTRHGLVAFQYFEAPFQTRDGPARIVEILRAVYPECRAGEYCAVAIVRGGGASADLAWLVDERLAGAVCRMPVPVITGIGHERDRNLLDEVACLPCDTPSKAAELVRTTVVNSSRAANEAIQTVRSQTRGDLDFLSASILRSERDISARTHEAIRISETLIATTARSLGPDARRLLDYSQNLATTSLNGVRMQARERHEAARAMVATAHRATGDFAQRSIRSAEERVQNSIQVVATAPSIILSKATDGVDAAGRTAGAHAQAALRDAEQALSSTAGAIVDAPSWSLKQAEIALTAVYADIATPALNAVAKVEHDLRWARREIVARSAAIPDNASAQVTNAYEMALEAATRSLDACETVVHRVSAQADALHPDRVVAAGYAIIRGPDGRPVTDVATLRSHQTVTAELRDGSTPLRPLTDEERK